ncbi:MAG: SAM-dependent methyltransferase [Gammaproteobacteria bacterium]|nr:SAM-dependent methyltransferase [Gammaproteobacteria bacterium]
MSDLNDIELTAAQHARTHACAERVRYEIKQQGGSIGFDQYMQLVLNDPAVGYYHGQQKIFGAGGDFITAPETSVHLAYCLAHACEQLIQDDPQRSILEIGAGSGKLACDVITYLHAWGQLPARYYIYEPSEALRVKQKKLLETEIPEHVSRIEWLPNLSGEILSAIIIANEVLDALPVKCFEVQADSIQERCVALSEDGNLIWQLQDPVDDLDAALDYITVMSDEPLGELYRSEINLGLENTLSAWTNCCEQCIMFLIDYGYPRSEYYHPQRSMGTLRSYYQHQVSEDPFKNPGLQDITADVDFSAVAKAATHLSLGVLSFGVQRNFMLANRLLEWQPSADNEVERIAQIAQLKQLTLGSAISERFQVMVLGKGIDYGADRFTLRDMRARL